MLELNDRKIDEYGNVIYNVEGIVDLLMSGFSIKNLILDNNQEVDLNNSFEEDGAKLDSLKKYNEPSMPITEYDKLLQDEFIIPNKYKEIDLHEYLLSKCSTEIEINRVEYEYDLIVKRNMINFFKCMIYLVDMFREHKLLWGVGRGSSVSSYSLFLIGIHKVNSIKYNLDCHEFFK